jgi:polyisoprenoid-binding protein YceI
MKQMTRLATLAALVGLSAIVPARAEQWTIDSSHSAAHFGVRHLMVSTVRGDFGNVQGTIEYDGKDVKSLKVEATLDVATVNTREPKRDEHLKSADFFDAEKFPKMTFKSKRVDVAGPGKVKLVGDLTLKGVTKEVVLDLEGPTPALKNPWGKTVVGASATAKINRSDFGVTWNKTLDAGGVVVSDEVTITIDVEAVKKEAAAPAK